MQFQFNFWGESPKSNIDTSQGLILPIRKAQGVLYNMLDFLLLNPNREYTISLHSNSIFSQELTPMAVYMVTRSEMDGSLKCSKLNSDDQSGQFSVSFTSVSDSRLGMIVFVLDSDENSDYQISIKPKNKLILRALERDDNSDTDEDSDDEIKEENGTSRTVGIGVGATCAALFLLCVCTMLFFRRREDIHRQHARIGRARTGPMGGTNNDFEIGNQLNMDQAPLNRQKKNLSLEQIENYFPARLYSEIHINFEQDSCPVCLDSFSMESQCRQIICGHIFHCGCIEKWLEIHDKCPLCVTVINSESIENLTKKKDSVTKSTIRRNQPIQDEHDEIISDNVSKDRKSKKPKKKSTENYYY